MNPVLPSTQSLVTTPEHVHINNDRLEAIAQEWAPSEFKIPAWDFPPYPASDERIVDFLFWGNTINFCFTNFAASDTENVKYTVEFEGKPQEGSSAMWASLRKAVTAYGDQALTGTFWRDISNARAREIFQGIDRAHDIPMYEERRQILHDVGDVLATRYARQDGGTFSTFIESCKQHGELRLYTNRGGYDPNGLLAMLIQEMPSFQDNWETKDNHIVEFNKRAQLAAAMAWGRSQNRDGTLFAPVDIKEMTVFADYTLPKVLRALGVLEYNAPLAETVDIRNVIPAGSQEELEIRASTVHAADRLITRINTIASKDIHAVHMDYKIFSAGRKMSNTAPHHYTTTTAY